MPKDTRDVRDVPPVRLLPRTGTASTTVADDAPLADVIRFPVADGGARLIRPLDLPAGTDLPVGRPGPLARALMQAQVAPAR